MGTYITYDDLIRRYSMIKKSYEDATDCEADLIVYAESELNGRLGKCFSNPLPVNNTTKDICIDLCYYRHIRVKDPKRAELLYKAIMGRIKGLCDGTEDMIDGSGNPIATTTAGAEVWSSTSDYYPTFSMLDASDPHTQVDPDLIDAEQSERS